MDIDPFAFGDIPFLFTDFYCKFSEFNCLFIISESFGNKGHGFGNIHISVRFLKFKSVLIKFHRLIKAAKPCEKVAFAGPGKPAIKFFGHVFPIFKSLQKVAFRLRDKPELKVGAEAVLNFVHHPKVFLRFCGSSVSKEKIHKPEICSRIFRVFFNEIFIKFDYFNVV